MTYGRLIGEAKQLLRRSLTSPVVLPTASDALAVCDARARLYRILAGALALHLERPHNPYGHQSHHGEGIRPHENILLEHLRGDLHRAAHTGQRAQEPPSEPAPVTARLVRAGDAAGAAFDLLAGHLAALHTQPAPGTPLDLGSTRVTARDAVQLAIAMTQLDGRLELPILSCIRPHLDDHTQHWLTTIAGDCRRIGGHGVHDLASTIEKILHAPARKDVDSLDIIDHSTTGRRSTSEQPSSAADLVGQLRRAAHQRRESLSIADLAAIASAGSRISTLTAYVCGPLGLPVGHALDVVGAWWTMRQDLQPFRTTSTSRSLHNYADQFHAWADPLIRHAHHTDFTNADVWLRPLQAMTAHSADLAHLLTTTISTQITAGTLLVPFDTRTRGREHLYSAAKPADRRVQQLRQTAAAVHRSARDLARQVHGLAPPGHQGARATRVPARGAPGIRTTGRTPPPPPAPQPRQPGPTARR